MKKLKQLGFAFAAIALAFTSCRKQELEKPQDGGRVEIITDQSQLRERVDFKYQLLTPDALKSINPIDLELVAEVNSPTVGGTTLAATHIQFSGNKAYVTYHTFGAGYGGAIDVFDVTDPGNPILLAQLSEEDTDFHNLDIAGNVLYVAGARDIDASGYSGNTKGAIVQRIELDGSGIPTSSITEVPLPSFSANSVRFSSGGVLVATGDVGGGSFVLNPTTLAVESDINVNDAKYIHGTSDYLAVLAGEGPSSKLFIYPGSNFSSAPLTVNLGNVDVTTVGKNAIEAYDDYVLVNLGDDGLMKVNRYNGQVLRTYKFTDGDGIAIGSIEFENYTILAYGCDGVLILDEKAGTYRKIASYKFSDNGSVNHVSTNGEAIFVASGLKGIRILRNLQKNCTLEHITEGSVDRAIWLEAYYPSTFTQQVFRWEGGTGTFVQSPDGTAVIEGVMINTNNPNDRWKITFYLKDKMNWIQWSGLGRSYMSDPGGSTIAGSHEDWFYYVMDPSKNSMMEGQGSNVGTNIPLSHKPSGLRFGFQLGQSANVKNSEYGLSGWFYYTNSAGDQRTGDINVNVTGC